MATLDLASHNLEPRRTEWIAHTTNNFAKGDVRAYSTKYSIPRSMHSARDEPCNGYWGNDWQVCQLQTPVQIVKMVEMEPQLKRSRQRN